MIDSTSVTHFFSQWTGVITATTNGLKPMFDELIKLLTLGLVVYQIIASKLRHKKTIAAISKPEEETK